MHLTNIMYLLMTMTLFLPVLESTISLGSMMLIMPMISAIMVAKSTNSWFAMILFLIYISGLLVMFSYMMAMSPNPKSFNKKTTIWMMSMLMVSLLYKKLNMINLPTNQMNYEWNVTMLFNKFNLTTYWLMTIILLITLIMVVFICFKSQSPLRPFLK